MSQSFTDCQSASFVSTQSSIHSESERSSIIVSNCVNEDLKPAWFCQLSATLLKPSLYWNFIDCDFHTKKLLQYANLLGQNHGLIVKIIKNILMYSEHYIIEEYAQDIEDLLENFNYFHTERELNFICLIIEKIQKSKDKNLNSLLMSFDGQDEKALSKLLKLDIQFARLLPLLAILYLDDEEKFNNDVCVKEVGLPELTSQVSTQCSSCQSSSVLH